MELINYSFYAIVVSCCTSKPQLLIISQFLSQKRYKIVLPTVHPSKSNERDVFSYFRLNYMS